MRKVQSKDTKLEIVFRRAFWNKGIKYRKNPKNYFGKPDLVLNRMRTVVFFDSCFWHGCKTHCRMPSTNKRYWLSKIGRNKKRDVEITKEYRNQGWQVIRIWEHERDVINNIVSNLRKKCS